MSDFFSGYDPTIENRDEIANTATPVLFALNDVQAPEEIDPRPLVRHDNQGNMGSCGGFGNTNCGEFLWGLITGSKSNDRQFSPLFSYLEAQRLDGLLGSDKGSTISSGLKISKEIGYLEAKHLPYSTPYPRNARTLITDEMRKIASAVQGFRIRSHAWLESYDDVFKYLASRAGAVYPGTSWNESHYGRNGVVESISFTNRDGGHAYAWLGYSKRKDSKGRNYIWRLNSHNDSWTEIAPSVIDQLCRHQWSSIVGMSDLLTPGPNRVSWKEARPLG
jgi:hypothetical protein